MCAQAQKVRILMADDSSEHAVAASALLCDLKLSPRSSIFVLRVFPVGQTHNVWNLQKLLDKTVERLSAAGHNVESDLLMGIPAPKIVEIAEEEQCDMIAMGSVGLRATLGILLGGVAQQVVEHASMPVLIVRKPYLGLKHILFATDGSDCSQEALKFIKRFPFPTDASLSVLNVLPPELDASTLAWTGMMDVPMAPITPEVEADFERIATQEKKDGEKLLEQTKKVLRKLDLPVETSLRRGDAATEIIEYAKQNKVDMIVVGSRGLGPMQGWLLGSVSRKLVNYAPCSVLVVKHCE